MLYYIFSAVAAIVVFVLIQRAERHGREAEENRNMKEKLDDLRKANGARDRVDSDAGFAKRLRARFTRRIL